MLRAGVGVVVAAFSIALPVGASAALDSAPDVLPVTDGEVFAQQVVGDTLYIGGGFDHVAMATGPAAEFSTADGLLRRVAAVTGGDGRIEAAVGDAAGGWYVAGDFSRVGGLPRPGLAHILAGGTVDPAFVPGPTVGPEQTSGISSLALSGRTLYVGGDFVSADGGFAAGLIALDASDGTAEPTFDADTDGPVDSLLVSAGTLYVAGGFQEIRGQAARSLAAVDISTGEPLAGFAAPITDSTGGSPVVDRLALVGSTLYISGVFDQASGSSEGLAALDATDGHLISSFTPAVRGGDAMTATASAVYVATPTSQAAASATQVVALDPSTGAQLAAFSVSTDGPINALQVVDGSLYVGGSFNRLSGAPRRNLGVVDPVTGAASPTILDPNGAVATIAPGTGTLLAVGAFASVRGVARHDLAAIDLATGAVLSGFDPEPDGPVFSLDLDAGALYVGGVFANIAGGTRASLAALDPTTGALLPFDAHLSGDSGPPLVDALAGNGRQLYLTGEFAQVGASRRGNLAEVDESDGSVTPFLADLYGLGNTLLLDGGTLYVAGSFSLVNGRPHEGVVALNAVGGTPVPTFNAQVDGNVGGLALSGRTLYLGGSFSQVDQLDRQQLSAVDAATGAVLPFDPRVYGSVYSLALDGSELELGGSFAYVAGVPRSGLAELDADGTPTSFDPLLAANVYRETVGADGSLLAAGLILTADRGTVGGFAEFSPTSSPTSGDITPPSANGTAAPGHTLTCDPGTWSAGVERLDTIWLTNGVPDPNSAGSTLTVRTDDEGHDLQCEVTGYSAGGSVSAISPARTIAGGVPIFELIENGLPAPSGPLAVGQYLRAAVGEWTPDPTGYDYQWQRCDPTGASCHDIPGATDPGYELTAADAGSTISLTLVALDNAGASTPITSAATAPVPAGLPQSISPPAIGPLAGVTGGLSATSGRWTDSPSWYQDQWERCDANAAGCQPIRYATYTSYEPVNADIGHTLVVDVEAVNGYGVSAPAASQASAVITAAATPSTAPTNINAPGIDGVDAVDATLTTETGSWTGSPTSYAYQWQRCAADGTACTDIPAATSPQYTTTPADAGDTILVDVTATDAGGTSLPAQSDIVGPIVAATARGTSQSPPQPPATSPPTDTQVPTTAAGVLPVALPAGGPTRAPLTLSLMVGSSSGLLNGKLLSLRVRCSAAATLSVTLTISASAARRAGLHPAGPAFATMRAHGACGPAPRTLRFRPPAAIARRLRAAHPTIHLTAQASATDGRRSPAVKRSLAGT
jgi:hypothetical protein